MTLTEAFCAVCVDEGERGLFTNFVAGYEARNVLCAGELVAVDRDNHVASRNSCGRG